MFWIEYSMRSCQNLDSDQIMGLIHSSCPESLRNFQKFLQFFVLCFYIVKVFFDNFYANRTLEHFKGTRTENYLKNGQNLVLIHLSCPGNSVVIQGRSKRLIVIVMYILEKFLCSLSETSTTETCLVSHAVVASHIKIPPK